MKTRHGPFILLLPFSAALILTLAATESNAADAAAAQHTRADKAYVLDGHVVHDVGLIWSHVSNWGLIGSGPGAGTTFSDAPSAQWPKYSGNEYLWAAGLWVGGVKSGETHVSTAGFSSEFFPTAALEDTIYPTYQGAPGGQRFPWPGADDDGDGLEDEDPLNGRDDDRDGLVDEDFAAWGDQHFVTRYNDFEPDQVGLQPDHTPMGLEVVQQSVQWSSPLGEDFIGYDFTITNAGPDTILNVYLGLFSDFDIGNRGLPGISADDYAGYFSALVRPSDGSWVPVQVAYMSDGADSARLDGYAGWVLCNHTTDPTGATAPVTPGVHGFQRFTGNDAFENGGDPTNDAERYQLLSTPEPGPIVTPNTVGDYRVLMSSGPFPSLAPGQSLRYQVALVLGSSLEDMLGNAAEAVLACRGRSYDRDGDPGNGEEFVVPWVLADEVPVAAYSGRLQAVAGPGGAELTITAAPAAAAGLQVKRLAGTGVPKRIWTSDELEPQGEDGANNRYRIRDDDPVGWPRQYELVYREANVHLPLDEAAADLPRPAVLALRADPNPFNPQVNLRISLPAAGAARLQVFDLRGHLVNTLLDGQQPAGEQTVVWRGQDQAGRAMSSGIYHLRLTAAGTMTKTRVTLVR